MVEMAAWLLLSASCAFATPLDPIWSKTFSPGQTGPLRVRFVRGTAEIHRRPGPIVITVHKRSDSDKGGSISIRVAISDEGIEVTDIYSALWMPMWHECLPVDAARGDFWNSDVRLRTIIQAPEEAIVDVSFMDGGDVTEE